MTTARQPMPPGVLWTAMGVLGFSSGLPQLLTGSTLQAWLKDSGVDLTLIGFTALLGLPYSLKFLWGPLVDTYPLLNLGRRRGWMAAAQLLTAALLMLLAWQDPRGSLGLMVALAFALAFASATQDLALDAWRTETLTNPQQGLGAAISICAGRIAMLVAGALALWMADWVSWRIVYLVMAGLMLPGILATVAVREPEGGRSPRNLVDAVVVPFQDFFQRMGAIEILAFILLYQLGVMMAGALTTVFLMDSGFSKGEIGLATMGPGVGSLIAGSLLAGLLMRTWSMQRSLLVFGCLQALSILTPYALALAGPSRALLYGTVITENLCSGAGTVALLSFLMRVCTRGMAATQFALLAGLTVLPATLLTGSAGALAKAVGWPTYFLACIVLALPGLLLLLRFDRWQVGTR